MVSSPQSVHDVRNEPPDDGVRYGHRHHFPFWLLFPLAFMLFRAPFFWGWGYGWHGSGGAFVPTAMAVLTFVLLAMVLMRLAGPLFDQALRSRSRRQSGPAEMDGQSAQRLDLELIDAHRRIKALEEQVAWQSKLLATQTAAPAGAVAPEAPPAG